MNRKQNSILLTKISTVALTAVFALSFGMLKLYHIQYNIEQFEYFNRYTWGELFAPLIVVVFFIAVFYSMKRLIRN